MHDLLPMPVVANLSSDNVLDLAALGDLALATYIPVGGIEDDDEVYIYPNWRGCGPSGAVFDDAGSMVPLDRDQVKPEGMPVSITNLLLKSLDQGWVFYSYSLEINGTRTAESARRFFYVGKRPQKVALLPVAQVRGAHDLHIDADTISDNFLTVVVLPYENMTAGDVVTFVWQGYTATGTARPVIKSVIELVKEQMGQPLEFTVQKGQVTIIKNGKAEISYSITYADDTKPVTQSIVQTFNIKASLTPFLPAIEIPGVIGYLDPSQYTQGLKLSVNNYGAIQAGDYIVLYAMAPRAGRSTSIVMPVDASTVDRGTFHALLEYQWLLDNTAQDVVFTYQFSRLGAAGASLPLPVNINKERKVTEFPHVPRATPGNEGEGELAANIAVNGIDIEIPAEVELFASDSVHVRFNQEGETGYYLGLNNPDNQRSFTVPMEAVTPNIGKKVQVYYQITPAGTTIPLVSPAYTLTVLDLGSGQVIAPICTKPASSGRLSKRAVMAVEVAEFTQNKFMFFQAGLWVKVYASVSGVKTYFRGTALQGVQVSSEETVEEKLIITINKDYVNGIAINNKMVVGAEISFDGGEEYKQFDTVSLTVVE